MIEIHDDVISEDLQNKILKDVQSNYFSWYLNDDTTGYGRENFFSSNIKEYLQFCHLYYAWDNEKQICYKNSNTEIVDKIIEDISNFFKWEKCEIYRVKANLQTQFAENHKSYFNTPHVDFHTKTNTTMIYYINDSDGDTLFFDNRNDLNIVKRVSPKKGRLVVFDTNIYHTGQHPIKSNKRIVLNINAQTI